MATSTIQVSEGSGKNIATNSFVEDAITKELQRIINSDPSGNAIFSAVTALADGMTNPSVGGIATFPTVFNGTSWDPARNATTASGSLGRGLPANAAMGQYNPNVMTLASGTYVPHQLDINGNMKVTNATLLSGEDIINNMIGVLMKPVPGAAYAPTSYKDSGTVTKATLKATGGNVFTVRITNANAAVRYLQLHNKTTTPAGGDTAQLYFLVPAGTATNPGVLDLNTNWFAPSEYFLSGIGYSISTTATTFTDSATASDHVVHVRYQ